MIESERCKPKEKFEVLLT